MEDSRLTKHVLDALTVLEVDYDSMLHQAKVRPLAAAILVRLVDDENVCDEGIERQVRSGPMCHGHDCVSGV